MNKDVNAEKELIKADVLASRWRRLGASLIDALYMMLVVVPVMYFTGGFDEFEKGIEPSIGYTLFLGALGIFVFFMLNRKPLIKNGQTLGKEVFGIKIVDLNGNLPTVKQHLLPRYGVYLLSGHVPIVGQVMTMLDMLFIFGKQKRCVHDYIAKTKVIIS